MSNDLAFRLADEQDEVNRLNGIIYQIKKKVQEMSNDHSIVCNGHCCDLHQTMLLDFLQKILGDLK